MKRTPWTEWSSGEQWLWTMATLFMAAVLFLISTSSQVPDRAQSSALILCVAICFVSAIISMLSYNSTVQGREENVPLKAEPVSSLYRGGRIAVILSWVCLIPFLFTANYTGLGLSAILLVLISVGRIVVGSRPRRG